jgi:DNA-binding XRE family transcriptional regulator
LKKEAKLVKFKELRMNKNMTQCELATAIGITQQAVASWESGRSKPMTDTIIKIAQAFDCPIQVVFECFIVRE